MAAISVRDLDDDVARELKLRATRHGRSMEAEVRAILTDAVSAEDAGPNLLESVRAGFAGVGGVDLDLPPRTDRPRAADLGE